MNFPNDNHSGSGIVTYNSTAAREPIEIEIVRRYQQIKDLMKDLEAEKAELQTKLNMIIPADLDAKAFTLPEVTTGRFVARRIEQDRRKPDDDLLLAELIKSNAPDVAYLRKPNHEYVASMIAAGAMSLDTFKATLKGKLVKYVSLSFRKNGEPD